MTITLETPAAFTKKVSRDMKGELFARRYFKHRAWLVESYKDACVAKSGDKSYILRGLIRAHYKTLVLDRGWTEAHFVLTLDHLLQRHMLLSKDNFYNVQPRS